MMSGMTSRETTILALRLAGIYVLLQTIDAFAGLAGWMSATRGFPSPVSTSGTTAVALLRAVALLAVTLGLLLWPARLVDFFRRFDLLRATSTPLMATCPACGYNLTGNTSGRCPECGHRVVGPVPPAPRVQLRNSDMNLEATDPDRKV